MSLVYDDVFFKEKLDGLIRQVQSYLPSADAEMIERAFRFAQKMHGEQKRESGEPFVLHPLMVAQILAEIQMDQPTIIAALLHDCLEDTTARSEEIEEMFSAEVVQLVDGVTKLDSIEFRSKDEAKAESLRKMFVAMAKDLRVVIIKLADRLHNMRTLRFRNEHKRIATATETLEVYAPLAHRLGINTIKWELEDLSLRFMDPHSYFELEEKVAMKREEREAAIALIVKEIRSRLDELDIHADIAGRPKHFYSIYRKMMLKDLTFDQVYDLIAVRVIVNDIRECYTALGTVHTLWKPIPGRFKDYISMPKPNLYQSLHTTVVGDRGMPFEVQIRTHEMHRIAEYGVAAHWRYKEGDTGPTDIVSERMDWIRQMVDAQSEVNDTTEFMDMLKVDLFSDEVFVFTPKGDVIDLPHGSTPLDFAYTIHSQVGNRCVGAKVNQRIVTLDTPLQTGDIVEVLTSSSSKGPSMDWLKIVKTTQARSKIRAALKANLRDQNILTGRDAMEYEAKKMGLELNKLIKKDNLEKVLRRLSMRTLDDLYASVGFGGLAAVQVVTRLAEEYKKTQKPEPAPEPLAQGETEKVFRDKSDGDASDVAVRGLGNMLVRYARCCNPVPGDEIIGYTTRGRGVSIHRSDCINIISAEKNPQELERLIEVSWAASKQEAYNADVTIIAYDRMGLLANVTNIIAKQGIPLAAISARASKNKTNTINLTLEIKDTQQLDNIIRQLEKSNDIIEVYRAGN